jgi:TRAP-type C4-dicarboxylate transport system permease small subunit
MAMRDAAYWVVSAYVMILRFLAGASMSVIVMVMITQVWSRYVMGGSIIWAEELCRYLLLWQTFLVLGLAYSRGEFVAMDFLPAALSDRSRWLLKAVTAMPVIVFLAVISYYGADYASRFANQTIPALDFIWGSVFGHPLGLSIGYVYISVSVGAALLSLHVLADVVTGYAALARTDNTKRPGDIADQPGTGGGRG